jgi:tRNA(fMet)-specific endonuclease VapC
MECSLLDTDMFSKVMRGRNQAIRARADAYLDVLGHLTLSVITVSEIVDGFRRQLRGDRIAEFMAEIDAGKHEIIALDLVTAVTAGRILGDLHRAGQPIGNADPFIAACAITHNLPLITGNVGHYERVQSLGYPLRLENWRAS